MFGGGGVDRFLQGGRQRADAGVELIPVFGRDREQRLKLSGRDFAVLEKLVADRTEEFTVVVGPAPDLFRSREGDLLQQLQQRTGFFGRRRVAVARVFEPRGELRVEIRHHVGPGNLAFLDLVELLLHSGRETDVEKLRKPLDEEVIHAEAEFGRNELALFAVHVVAILNRAQDRRVGRRAADAVFLELLDQRGFAVSRRRLGELLLGLEIPDRQRIAGFEAPSTSASRLSSLLFFASS